jgi:hypothetical protein
MATLTVKSKETIQHLLQGCYAEIDSLKLTNQSDVINKLEGNLKQIEGLVTNMLATNADEYRLNDLSAYLGLEAKRLLGDDPTNARTSRRVRIQGFSKRPPLKPILDHITKMNIPRGQIYDTRQSRDVDHGFGPHTIVIDFMRWENAFDFAQSQQGRSFPFHWFSDDKVETVYVEHHQNTISTEEIVKLEASNTTRILVVWKRRNSFPEKFIHELFEEDKVRKPNDIPEPNLRQPAVGLEAKHLEYLQHFGFTSTESSILCMHRVYKGPAPGTDPYPYIGLRVEFFGIPSCLERIQTMNTKFYEGCRYGFVPDYFERGAHVKTTRPDESKRGSLLYKGTGLTQPTETDPTLTEDSNTTVNAEPLENNDPIRPAETAPVPASTSDTTTITDTEQLRSPKATESTETETDTTPAPASNPNATINNQPLRSPEPAVPATAMDSGPTQHVLPMHPSQYHTLNTETIEIKIPDLAQLVELTTRTIMDGYIRHTITLQVPCYFTQDRVAQYRSVGDVQTVRVQTQRVWMHVKAVGQTVLKNMARRFR